MVLLIWPLVFLKGHSERDPFVSHYATNALNETQTGLTLFFGLVMVAVISLVLTYAFVSGIPVIASLIIYGFVRVAYEIVASIRAYHSQRYTFPVWAAYRFVEDAMSRERSLALSSLPCSSLSALVAGGASGPVTARTSCAVMAIPTFSLISLIQTGGATPTSPQPRKVGSSMVAPEKSWWS